MRGRYRHSSSRWSAGKPSTSWGPPWSQRCAPTGSCRLIRAPMLTSRRSVGTSFSSGRQTTPRDGSSSGWPRLTVAPDTGSLRHRRGGDPAPAPVFRHGQDRAGGQRRGPHQLRRGSERDARSRTAFRDALHAERTGKANFAIDARQAADLCQNVGLDFAGKLLDPSFNDFIKTIVPTYPVNDILKSRDAIRDKTKERLNQAVNP